MLAVILAPTATKGHPMTTTPSDASEPVDEHSSWHERPHDHDWRELIKFSNLRERAALAEMVAAEELARAIRRERAQPGRAPRACRADARRR